MCMSFVAAGSSLTIVSYVTFKMAALWFWTMFNCNPPISHCHPLLWGGGILVDHWSTISSSVRNGPIATKLTANIFYWTLNLKYDHWIWPWIFKVKIWILPYLSQKWFDCHKMNSNHINWTLGIKCDYLVWPWRQKSMWTQGLLTLGFWSNFEIAPLNKRDGQSVSQSWPWRDLLVRCKDLLHSDRGDFRCRRAVDSSGYYDLGKNFLLPHLTRGIDTSLVNDVKNPHSDVSNSTNEAIWHSAIE